MRDKILIVVMSVLGIGLAINPRFFKGASWLISGLISQLLK